MNLKEAFRYKKFLNELANDIITSMRNQANIMETTRIHNMNAANSEAADKVETINDANLVDINAALRMYQKVTEETEKLAEAIDKAKTSMDFSLDGYLQGNTQRRLMAKIVRGILAQKDSETQSTGTGYKFNNEGTQVPYIYDITVKKTARFNRSDFKSAMNDALKTSDEASAKIDEALVTVTVGYDAPWDVNETVEDILPSFVIEPDNKAE